ncbi:site-specific integrase [Thalassotalea profundi]|uniref:Site-specific integrase n=1 Tax=Thalassotalea profundi TaxID=2036687 RepID=A0ABQ3IVI2_9GAMM|nr:site-specific integrase [Thalassotalea profundi]GHE92336.1 hypothetical protein GCM10011501_22350 [Thalassotalea profundi]
MNETNLENNISLIQKVGENKKLLIPLFAKTQEQIDSKELELPEFFWLPQLLSLSVTSVNQFKENEWDYNKDTLNPSRSVQGAKLKINFSKYSNIPAYVMTELKCLCHLVMLVPMQFRKNGKGQRSKKSIKPNTVIAHFEAGLRYIDSVFHDLNGLGLEFVHNKFQSLTDILDSDYRKTAKKFNFTVGPELMVFLGYLNHPYSSNVLGTEIKVDFSTLDWPEQNIKKRKAKLIFENSDFEKLINHSTFTVVDFLLRISKNVEDKTALSYYNVLNKEHRLNFEFNEHLLNDYTLVRLLSKGYSKEFIETTCSISKEYLKPDGSLMYHEGIRPLIKEKYQIKHFDEVRRYINEVYYSSAYLISQLAGMRPEEMCELILSKCLNVHDGFDVLVSNVKKNKFENLKLFDDKWVAIPIMKDAVQAASLISSLKNNDYLFSNVDTVSPDDIPTNMNPTGIRHFFGNFLNIVLGKDRTEQIIFTPYMIRHTLAYQLHRIELGLPFISFQLKHIVDKVGSYTSMGAASNTTLGYGEIADNIVLDKAKSKKIRRYAEVERVKNIMDPNGTYVGPKATEHKERVQKVFQGYMEAGYSKDEIFDAMAEQGLAVINVGAGFCFGGVEDYDESLPCIGSLRCNPNRCSNAIVSKANAPKWREVFVSNSELVGKEGYEDRQDQIIAAVEEARGVLIYLGEAVDQ